MWLIIRAYHACRVHNAGGVIETELTSVGAFQLTANMRAAAWLQEYHVASVL